MFNNISYELLSVIFPVMLVSIFVVFLSHPFEFLSNFVGEVMKIQLLMATALYDQIQPNVQ